MRLVKQKTWVPHPSWIRASTLTLLNTGAIKNCACVWGWTWKNVGTVCFYLFRVKPLVKHEWCSKCQQLSAQLERPLADYFGQSISEEAVDTNVIHIYCYLCFVKKMMHKNKICNNCCLQFICAMRLIKNVVALLLHRQRMICEGRKQWGKSNACLTPGSSM